MKEKPILFNTQMVNAILAGNKTQTRRIVKAGFDCNSMEFHGPLMANKNEGTQAFFKDREWFLGVKSKYEIGDILYVKETYLYCLEDSFLEGFDSRYVYRASVHPDWFESLKESHPYCKWTPSIHMPRYAARIFLKVTNVRVERLQDITEHDAVAEGIKRVWIDERNGQPMYENYLSCGYTEVLPIDSYHSLWESINGKGSWNDNPWVWVYEFERVKL
jgi:hypothetical protein